MLRARRACVSLKRFTVSISNPGLLTQLSGDLDHTRGDEGGYNPHDVTRDQKVIAILSALTVDTSVTDSDRLSLTLCLAILFHAILILGVTFIPPVRDLPSYETMEIVLVNSKSDQAPENSKLLAQANQIGGGEEATDTRPSTPLTTPIPTAVAAVPMAPTPQLTPELPAPPVETSAERQSELVTEAPPTQALEPSPQTETTPSPQELVAEAETELNRQLSLQWRPLPIQGVRF